MNLPGPNRPGLIEATGLASPVPTVVLLPGPNRPGLIEALKGSSEDPAH